MQETDMNIRIHKGGKVPERGFSLLELLVVVLILTTLCAAIFTQIDQVIQRAAAEQVKVDNFQQARDFVDQIFRDSRQIGYPNVRTFDVSVTPPSGPWQSVLKNDSRLASGLVKVSGNELQFEGDVDGSGSVSVVSYKINGNAACANCLQRAQVSKVNGDPLTGQTNLSADAYSDAVQNVQNTTSVFTVYDATGTALTLPLDNTNPLIADVKVIQVQLTIASANAVDPKTRQPLEADIGGRIQILNCSMATTGRSLTCN
jgi:prepilin-type N-terminal cleavage/methylation domain-containing protein